MWIEYIRACSLVEYRATGEKIDNEVVNKILNLLNDPTNPIFTEYIQYIQTAQSA